MGCEWSLGPCQLVRRTLQLRRQFTERSEGKVTEGCALKSLERRKKDGE